MKLCTTSETISFARDMEEKSANLYEKLAQRYPEAKDLLSYKEENRKFAIQIQRAYQSVITDAIEGCFAFQVESDDYEIKTDLAEGTDFKEAVKQALAMEEKIIDFYNTAADQSMALMADIPRNFKLVAKKRAKRIDQLKAFC
ncbi:MAG: hypothetical protein JRH18_17335 [Deltaproteobacteria bacterium]|nr:hypothetical protein [Deltaproteobacteria bacterium]MBW1960414.1 hypothetical protein [Deltaproteobacteria bacterium]MBW2153420.1 hypothetical protein [Deltaproteobacteria bacterium]